MCADVFLRFTLQDLESEPAEISYTKNGEDLGKAFEFEKASLDGAALFPHVLTKNSEFELNFGARVRHTFLQRLQFVCSIDSMHEEQLNISHMCLFYLQEEPFFPIKDGFQLIGQIAPEMRVRGCLPPVKKEDCEVS